MTDNDANIHTVSVRVPDWLKERFGNGLSEYEADDYKKLSAIIKDNSVLEITFKDLSDKTLDLAAADYCYDWYLLEPEQQQELRENIQDWIGALLVAGAISVSPQSKTEKPFWKPIEECPKEELKTYLIAMKSGNVCTGWYNRENKQWEGDAECYKKSLFAYYAEIPPLEAE
ncbi:hypothetical protein H3S83_10775 [Bartonella sp. W8122]|uniref:hypothetical protein n=1 Tax=Bartonella sp. W8122 TaxID=2750930 RepID=UPI0018DC5C45|nr:hypothetical protein [Bartonella sp. W8122]MBI0002306.1 hypothetical protein [Bartonella sp. W8122]